MTDAHSLFTEGVAALQSGLPDKARRLLARSIALDPVNEHAWLFLSLTLPDDKAADALERVLRINPTNASAHAALDALNGRLGRASSPPILEDRPTQRFTPVNVEQPTLFTSIAPQFAPYDPAAPVAPGQIRDDGEDPHPADQIPAFQQDAQFNLPDWMADDPAFGEARVHDSPTYRNGHSYTPVTRAAYSSANANASADGSFEPDDFDPADSPSADFDLRQALLDPLPDDEREPVSPRPHPRRPNPMNDDIRRTLDDDLRAVRRGKRRSGLAIALVVLCLLLLVAVIYIFALLSRTGTSGQPTALDVVDLPTAAPRATATLTIRPTSTAAPTSVPTSTPLPRPADMSLILGQEAAIDGYALRPEIFSPNSPDFSALGADPPVKGTHYEGLVVVVANRTERAIPVALGFFQGVDDKGQRVTAIAKGRLPNLDVVRLQPGEQRRAWLTFAVANGATLRSVIFQASTARATIDVTQAVKTTPKPGATKTPGVSDGSIGNVNDTPIVPTLTAPPITRSGLNEQASAGGFNVMAQSYDPKLPTNVVPRLLPAGYHYEIVRVVVDNVSSNSTAASILAREAAGWVLRDGSGLVFTQGPIETTARFRYEDFASATGKPAKTNVSGSLYFLVRDSAAAGRVLQFYPGTDYDVPRIEFTLK